MHRSSRIAVLLSVFGTFAAGQSRIASGAWTTLGAMSVGRTGACAAQLADGRVLIAGGLGNSGALDSVEILDPGGAFTSAAPMSTARSAHACVTMDDGRVLVAGGANNFAAIPAAEIYDPATNRWSPAGDMSYARSGHTATPLKDGQVLIAGGEGQGAVRNTIELFEPGNNSFRLVSNSTLASPRKEHGAALLQDGRVLIAGGSDGAFALDSSDLFDPATESIAAGPKLASARTGLSVTTLLDGSVLIAGGNNGSENLATAEIYDSATNKLTDAGRMTAPRRGQLAFLLPNNNQVLLVGGDQAASSAELFTPWRRSFGPTGGMGEARSGASGAALGLEGGLIVAGGRSRTQVLQSSGLYRFPTLKTDQELYPRGSSVKISGSGWQPGERVTLSLQDSPKKRDDRTLTVNADSEGNISTSTQASGEDSTTSITAQALAAAGTRFASAGASLSQCANGGVSNPQTNTGCANSTDWVSGNLGASKAHYLEGQSIPYRLTMTGVSTAFGNTHTVTVEWDTTKGGKHALDYITTYNSPQAANPCAGVSGCGSSTVYPIPPDPIVAGYGVTQIPGNFTLYGGTITAVSTPVISTGAYSSDSSTRITVTFTASVTSPVLAWGGHIATRKDWGVGNSTISISGSPFHTRLIELDGGGGNQDRALSSDAAIFPAIIEILKNASPSTTGAMFGFSTTGGLSPATFSILGTNTDVDAQSYSVTTFTTYTVTENDPATTGWSFVSATCNVTITGTGGSTATVSGRTATIVLKEGDTVQCTYNNLEVLPTLTLIKTVTKDNGGTADPSAWTLTATPSGSTTPTLSGTTGVSGSVAAGTYALAESAGPAGYTASTYSCVKNGVLLTSANSITLALGDVATCTINNNDNAPLLTLIKLVTIDNGGTAVPAAWTLTATGTLAIPTNLTGKTPVMSTSGFKADTYRLEENGGPAGYTASYSCVKTPAGSTTSTTTSSNTITLGPGDSATCTITNNDNPPSLTLHKTVTKTHGGTATAGAWTLTATGTGGSPFVLSGSDGVTSLSTFKADTYTLAETGGPAGYTQSGPYSCVKTPAGGSAQAAVSSNTIVLGPGDSAVCTVDNHDVAPSLTLHKTVTKTHGGTATGAAWTLTATGTGGSPTSFSGSDGVASGPTFQADTYTLSESGGPAGYTPTTGVFSCIKTPAGGSAQLGVASNTIALAAGDSAVCTIDNHDNPATLTLVKHVDNTNGGSAVATLWLLSAGGPTPISGLGGVAAASVNAGAYTLSESNTVPGYDNGTAYNCDYTPAVGSKSTLPSVTSINLGVGDVAVCTITNTARPTKLTITKICAPSNDAATTFSVSVTLKSPLTLGCQSNATTPNSQQIQVTPGTYTVGETPPSGWVLGANVSTTFPGWSAPGTFSGDCDSSGSVTLTTGQNKTCYILNVSNVCTPAFSFPITTQAASDFNTGASAVRTRAPSGTVRPVNPTQTGPRTGSPVRPVQNPPPAVRRK